MDWLGCLGYWNPVRDVVESSCQAEVAQQCQPSTALGRFQRNAITTRRITHEAYSVIIRLCVCVCLYLCISIVYKEVYKEIAAVKQNFEPDCCLIMTIARNDRDAMVHIRNEIHQPNTLRRLLNLYPNYCILHDIVLIRLVLPFTGCCTPSIDDERSSIARRKDLVSDIQDIGRLNISWKTVRLFWIDVVQLWFFIVVDIILHLFPWFPDERERELMDGFGSVGCRNPSSWQCCCWSWLFTSRMMIYIRKFEIHTSHHYNKKNGPNDVIFLWIQINQKRSISLISFHLLFMYSFYFFRDVRPIGLVFVDSRRRVDSTGHDGFTSHGAPWWWAFVVTNKTFPFSSSWLSLDFSWLFNKANTKKYKHSGWSHPTATIN